MNAVIYGAVILLLRSLFQLFSTEIAIKFRDRDSPSDREYHQAQGLKWLVWPIV